MRLKREGLIAKPHSIRQPLALGAILAAAVAGVLTLQPRETAAPGQLYMLALYTDDNYQAEPEGDRSRAKEYGEWARSHSEGPAAVVGGEELRPPVITLGPAPDKELVGYFTVRARSQADAVALAKTTPHLRYGGAVSVRPAAT